MFPANFARSMPIKGSLVFWFNTLSDGSPDFSTGHEECPVVWGQKRSKLKDYAQDGKQFKFAVKPLLDGFCTVAYKRIRFNDQFQARKCLMKPKSRFQVPVNGKMIQDPRTTDHQLIELSDFLNAEVSH